MKIAENEEEKSTEELLSIEDRDHQRHVGRITIGTSKAEIALQTIHALLQNIAGHCATTAQLADAEHPDHHREIRYTVPGTT